MNRPHFLEFPLQKKRPIPIFLYTIAVLFGSFWVVLFSLRPGFAALIALVGIIIFFVGHIEWGIYVLALTAFFHGWEIDFSRYSWAREIPYLPGINAPIVDFIALLFFICISIALLLRIRPFAWKHVTRVLPYGHVYGAFLLIAGISTLGAYEHNIGLSIKFLLRPMVFVYIFFVVLPALLLQKKEHLRHIVRILSWVAVAIALFGALGFVKTFALDGWSRVQPFSIFGIAPLGYNHNMIAEALVALLPFSAYRAYDERKHSTKRFYSFLSAFVFTICLLTLSRAAWIVIAVELCIIGFLYKKKLMSFVKNNIEAFVFPVAAIGVLLVGYMTVFLGSPIVSSSNAARIATTDIALFYTLRAPLLGYGPGMFVPILGGTHVFVSDFGEPLDAHGILLKLGVETGILGIATMLLFLAVVLYTVYTRARKTDDSLLLCLYFSAFGIILFQLFNTSYFNAHMWFPIGLALAGLQLSRYGDEYVS